METDAVGTSWDDVVTVIDVFDEPGCRHWIDGGWGVDVLGGTISRSHRDLDPAFDAAYDVSALASLDHLGDSPADAGCVIVPRHPPAASPAEITPVCPALPVSRSALRR